MKQTKAQALGMTKEAYKVMRQEQAKIKSYEYAIQQAENDIADYLARIEEKKAKIAVWKEKIAVAK